MVWRYPEALLLCGRCLDFDFAQNSRSNPHDLNQFNVPHLIISIQGPASTVLIVQGVKSRLRRRFTLCRRFSPSVLFAIRALSSSTQPKEEQSVPPARKRALHFQVSV